MDKIIKKIDELLEKQSYVIDILPMRVPEETNGQYFEVEHYFLNSHKYCEIKDKFVNIILKLMCYYHISILWDRWIDKPNPKIIDHVINEIMRNHSGTLYILFPDENSLLVFEWDCLNLSVYNPNDNMKILMGKLALAEGLFFWKSENEMEIKSSF